MGWIGPSKAVMNYLSVVHADKGDDGRFIISGEPVAAGLGGDELVVPDGTVYFVHGQPKNLAAGLGATSQGVGGIKVFNPRRNPIASADEMVAIIKKWLRQNDLASSDIRFWSPDKWNENHGDWQSTIDNGFMVLVEGTNFGADLSGNYPSPEATAIYQGFTKLLQDHGWRWQAWTGWAFHAYPDDGQLALRRSNPATVSSLERYTPEELAEMPTLNSGHWADLKVEDGKFRWWLSRMTLADGATHAVWVDELLPRQGWQQVHQYGALTNPASNPARHVHRDNFAGYAKSAVTHMQLAREAVTAGDKGRAWNMIRHAECDVRQAYTEANYAHRNDAELRRMSGRLVTVHREIVSTMKELRRAQNPATSDHIYQLAQFLDTARAELDIARAHEARADHASAAQIAGQAETNAIFAVLQVEYLLEHAGETVAWDQGDAIKIPSKQKLSGIKSEAQGVAEAAQQVYVNAVCEVPRPWTQQLGGRRTLH